MLEQMLYIIYGYDFTGKIGNILHAFLGKIWKIVNLSSAESAQKVVKVQTINFLDSKQIIYSSIN